MLAAARYDHCLITGASSGIGAAFARQLAAKARRLTLVARREDRLRSLAGELEAGGGPRCEVVVCDLCRDGAVPRLIEGLGEGTEREVDLLVNNAGFGRHGAMRDWPVEDFSAMIALNVRALTELTLGLQDQLIRVPGRGVIHVASAAGFQAVPWLGVYAATKAYVRSFSHAFREEGRAAGVRSLSLCPGPVKTEFGEVSGLDARGKPHTPVERVVRLALRAYEAGRLELVPGLPNKALAWVARHAPVALTVRVAGALYRGSGGKPRATDAS